MMDGVADSFNTLFENSMSRWIGDHDAGKFVGVLFSLLFDLLSQDVSFFIAMNWDDLHAADLSSGRVGSVSRCWAQANVSLEIASALVILFDGHETSVLTSGTTVRLRGHSVILGDGNEVVFDLFNELVETLSLLDWNVWMKVSESIPSNWNHANSRVELHGARSERDHRVGQT